MTLRLSLLILALFWTPIATSDTGPTRHPNVILFFVDDMGWSDIGVNGSSFYETPNIDALAANGVRFTDAYAASHVCSPTRASLMTGKYPARLQLTEWLPGRNSQDSDAVITAPKADALALDETTIAEAFKANGYRTAIIGKWHLGEGDYGPMNQGFDFQVPRGARCCPKGGYLPPYVMEGLDIEGREEEYLTDRLTEFAVNFIGESPEQPYFLYMSHFAVHDPIQGRADLVEKYKQKLAAQPSPEGPAFILEGNPDDPEPLTRAQLDALIKEPTHADHGYLPGRTVKIKQRQDNVEFAAMVESVDESLGRILQALEANNAADNTIIVFYSDNGGLANGHGKAKWGKAIPAGKAVQAKMYAAGLEGGTSNLPFRGAKGWLYEGGIRVPPSKPAAYILAWTAFPAGMA
ncbi:MAG: sulfatase-like hydrolase/transferase, partial [Pseudomonadota bacterium]